MPLHGAGPRLQRLTYTGNSEKVIKVADGDREPEPTTAFNSPMEEDDLEVATTEKPKGSDIKIVVTEEEAPPQPAVEVDARPLGQRFIEFRE